MKPSSRDLFLLALCVCLLAAFTSSSVALSSNSSSSSSSSSSGSSSKAAQVRQSPRSTAYALASALGSLVPGIISNVAPLVLLVGLGALMMPQLGLGSMGLLRDSRRSAQDPHQQLAFGGPPIQGAQFAPLNGQFNFPRPLQSSPQDVYYFTKRSLDTSPPSAASWLPSSEQVVNGLQETLERVSRALENADKRYN